MTQDFFADLERQLVAAAAERRARIRRARTRRAATISTILVAILAGGAGLAAAVTGGDGDRSGLPAATTTLPPAPAPARTVESSAGHDPLAQKFTVAVLNATTTPGLARGVATRLAQAGVHIGNVTNAAAQDAARTEYHYVPGYRSKATLVSVLLREVDRPTVAPATAAERAVAGRQAKVIVIVGADQARSSPQH